MRRRRERRIGRRTRPGDRIVATVNTEAPHNASIPQGVAPEDPMRLPADGHQRDRAISKRRSAHGARGTTRAG